jgi:hypothetical protein
MNKQIVIAIAFFLLGLSLAFAQTNSTTTAENDDALVAASSVEYDFDTSAGSSLAPLAAALSALF